jgi:peptidoglycan-N-acetylglucosamine deacetylase
VRIAITVDTEHADAPTRPGTLEQILELLDSRGARATFFVQGRWADAQPRLAAEIRARGHLLGNHSHYHARMTLLSSVGLREDVRRAESAILDATGVDPRPWFRCPFGDGEDDARVQAVLADLGYRHVPWDVATDDWRVGRRLDELVADSLADALARGDGAIVLFHSWPEITPPGLERMLDGLGDRGARFVTVAELDGDAADA